jgi:hypothetical protein
MITQENKLQAIGLVHKNQPQVQANAHLVMKLGQFANSYTGVAVRLAETLLRGVDGFADFCP